MNTLLRKYKKIEPYIPAIIFVATSVIPFCYSKDVRASLAVGSGAVWYNILLYHFAHANVFHLAANAMAILPFKPRWTTIAVGYAVSSLSALVLMLVAPDYGPTGGLSALIFACIARRYASWRIPIWKPVLINCVFIFIPGVDWMIHLLSFLVSYVIWRAVRRLTTR